MLWQIRTLENDFMNVKTYIVLNSEVRINTYSWKHFDQPYQVRYINKKISVAPFRLG